MKWWHLYRSDISRYTEYSRDTSAKQLLTQQGLWALLPYRIGHWLYNITPPNLITRFFLFFIVIWQKIAEIITGISLPYTAKIGSGFYIGHFGGIILNGDAEIGEQCNISQGVTIGVSGRGTKRGVPKIGSRVYIGANAVVAGLISIGDDVVIGANSLVVEDVPSHTTVVGVPAVMVSQHGSEDYLFPHINKN